MEVIEQLSLEREQLRKQEPTKEVLERIRLLDDMIDEVQLKNRKVIEIKPGNEKTNSFLCDKISVVLERAEEEHKSLYWTTLISNSIDELEEELNAWFIFSDSQYGARNLLNDMEKEGIITFLTNGIVKKKDYQIHQKEKTMVKKDLK